MKKVILVIYMIISFSPNILFGEYSISSEKYIYQDKWFASDTLDITSLKSIQQIAPVLDFNFQDMYPNIDDLYPENTIKIYNPNAIEGNNSNEDTPEKNDNYKGRTPAIDNPYPERPIDPYDPDVRDD